VPDPRHRKMSQLTRRRLNTISRCIISLCALLLVGIVAGCASTPSPPRPGPARAAAATSPSAIATYCYPRSDSRYRGSCYEAGEYCPDAYHDMTGVAGHGQTITCAYDGNDDRWRWQLTRLGLP
jgi:hypothetical protein